MGLYPNLQPSRVRKRSSKLFCCNLRLQAEICRNPEETDPWVIRNILHLNNSPLYWKPPPEVERKLKNHILLSEFVIRMEFVGCFGLFRAFFLPKGFVNDRKKIKAQNVQWGESSLSLLIQKRIYCDKSCSGNGNSTKLTQHFAALAVSPLEGESQCWNTRGAFPVSVRPFPPGFRGREGWKANSKSCGAVWKGHKMCNILRQAIILFFFSSPSIISTPGCFMAFFVLFERKVGHWDQASQGMFKGTVVLCPLLLKPVNHLAGDIPSFPLENREESFCTFSPSPGNSNFKMLSCGFLFPFWRIYSKTI